MRLAVCVAAIWLIGGLAAVALRLGDASCVEDPTRFENFSLAASGDAPKPGPAVYPGTGRAGKL